MDDIRHQRLLKCFIPGKPEPQGSTKAFAIRRRSGALGAVVTSDNPKLKSWRALAVWVMRETVSDCCRPLFTGAVFVGAEIALPRLASHPKTTKGREPGLPVTSPDLDKLIRAIGDALTVAGIVGDDAQIAQWSAIKRYARLGEMPGVHIRVSEMPDGDRGTESHPELSAEGRLTL